MGWALQPRGCQAADSSRPRPNTSRTVPAPYAGAGLQPWFQRLRESEPFQELHARSPTLESGSQEPPQERRPRLGARQAPEAAELDFRGAAPSTPRGRGLGGTGLCTWRWSARPAGTGRSLRACACALRAPPSTELECQSGGSQLDWSPSAECCLSTVLASTCARTRLQPDSADSLGHRVRSFWGPSPFLPRLPRAHAQVAGAALPSASVLASVQADSRSERTACTDLFPPAV